MATGIANPFRQATPDWSAPDLWYLELIRERAQLPFHRSLPGYAPTPLRELPQLAAELGLGAIYVKDEGPRFGIDSFKGLASTARSKLLLGNEVGRKGSKFLALRYDDLPFTLKTKKRLRNFSLDVVYCPVNFFVRDTTKTRREGCTIQYSLAYSLCSVTCGHSSLLPLFPDGEGKDQDS